MRTSSYKNLRNRKNTIRKKTQRKNIAKWMENRYPSMYYTLEEDTSKNPRVYRYYSSRRAGSAKSWLKHRASRICRHSNTELPRTGRQYKKQFDVFWNLY